MNKKVSIIVPIYNVENQLERCLESLIKQTYPHIEIILIDDGSTDSSSEICQHFLKKDPRILYYFKENGGLSDARNYGIDRATGEYMIFVDSDDYVDAQGVKRLLNEMVTYDLDLLLTNTMVERDGEIFPGIEVESFNEQIMTGEEYLVSSLKSGQYAAPVWINMYASELIKGNDIKFVKNLVHEDEHWLPRVLISAKRVKFTTNFSFYHYVIRNGSLTQRNDLSKNIKDIMWICEDLETYFLKNSTNVKPESLNVFRNHLVSLYIEKVSVDVRYVKEFRKQINKKFLMRNASKRTTRLKALIFVINPFVYLNIRKIQDALNENHQIKYLMK